MVQVRAVVALLLALALPSAALAGDAKAPTKAEIDEARQRRDRGLKLYEEGAYDAALVEFERAYAIAPTYKLLYNVALAHRQLNDFAAAVRALEQFLRDGAGDVPAKRRADVERELTDLRARVATVSIAVSVPGAEVTLDGVSLGLSPLAGPVLTNPGKRTFGAKKSGFEQTATTIAVAGSDSPLVELVLVESEKPHIAAAPAPLSPPPPAEPRRSVPWVAWGATGVLALSAGMTGYLAIASSRDLAAQRDAAGQSRASLDASHDKTKKLALVADVLGAGALAAGGVALWLTLRRPDDRGGVEARLIPGGVVVRGSF